VKVCSITFLQCIARLRDALRNEGRETLRRYAHVLPYITRPINQQQFMDAMNLARCADQLQKWSGIQFNEKTVPAVAVAHLTQVNRQTGCAQFTHSILTRTPFASK
jgi:hypothetical protein